MRKARALIASIALASLLPVVLAQGTSSVYDYNWGQTTVQGHQGQGQVTSTTPYDWGQSQVDRAYTGRNGLAFKSSGSARPHLGDTRGTDAERKPTSTRDEAKLKGGPGALGGMKPGKLSALPD